MAPYLDYRGATPGELAALKDMLKGAWLTEDWEHKALGFALRELVPKHVEEVRRQRLPLIDKIEEQVKARLLKEINHWDRRAQDLRAQEAAGKQTRLSSRQAEDRANKLSDRLQARTKDLQLERSVSPQPARIVGGALIVPGGLLRSLGAPPPDSGWPTVVDQAKRTEVELAAVAAVMAAEERLGRSPKDVGKDKLGYDVESKDRKSGDLFFIEVKGLSEDTESVTVTRNEVLRALNVPDRFRLAIVRVKEGKAAEPVYVTECDWGQPGFGQTHSVFKAKVLLDLGGVPR